jgi:hypothetical protein
MDNLFDKWKTKIPKYDEEFREMLFDSLSKKFGGSEKSKVDLGKHFSSNYELYMYAFFLGLYHDEYVPIPEKSKKVDFSHAIQHWGSKSTRLERKDFTVLQEYIFAALIAKAQIDFIALEKGDVTEDDAIKQLIHTMESYTNGGLVLIKEKLEENSNLFLQPTSFLNMILDSQKVAKPTKSESKPKVITGKL